MKRSAAAAALLVASGCCYQAVGEGDGGGSSGGGIGCTADSQCRSGEYCAAQFSDCFEDLTCPSDVPCQNFGPAILTGGSCHRDCTNGACTCTNDTDCPTSVCDAGRCLPIYYDCGPNAGSCPAGCPNSPFTETLCGLCLCQSCPGGSSSGGMIGGSSSGGSTSGGGSSGGSSSGGSGGVACTADAQCGSNAYCDIPLTSCAQYDDRVEQGPGSCHRSCWGGACACEGDADCPGGTCLSNGSCAGMGGDCAPQPSCSTDCPQTTFEEEACPVCLCSACPGVDAGGCSDIDFCACGNFCVSTCRCDGDGGCPLTQAQACEGALCPNSCPAGQACAVQPGDAGDAFLCSPLCTSGGVGAQGSCPAGMTCRTVCT
ncbi:MAG: hypothetical protein ACYDCL_16505 [Myxococcales bacterium]